MCISIIEMNESVPIIEKQLKGIVVFAIITLKIQMYIVL